MYILNSEERVEELIQGRKRHDIKERFCLSCRKSFKSMNNGNRVCGSCKRRASYHGFDDPRDFMIPNAGLDALRASLDS